MKTWLWSLIGVSVLCAAAMALCPKGRVRAVTGFVCALVCMLALIEPLRSPDPLMLSASMEYWREQAETVTAPERELAQNEQRSFIEQRCRTYILDEAQSLGVEISDAEVQAVWDEEKQVWAPLSARLSGPFSAKLSRAVEAGLGIGGEAQEWVD